MVPAKKRCNSSTLLKYAYDESILNIMKAEKHNDSNTEVYISSKSPKSEEIKILREASSSLNKLSSLKFFCTSSSYTNIKYDDSKLNSQRNTNTALTYLVKNRNDSEEAICVNKSYTSCKRGIADSRKVQNCLDISSSSSSDFANNKGKV